ncbi:MAG: hypothetical protein ACI80H_000264 [Pseudoalteromonas distincta]|jgi:hypothetical protein
MEQNLPFVSLSITDKAYNKFIIPYLGKLDDGNVFKNVITSILWLLSIGLLLGGIYLSIYELFGDYGYIETSVTAEHLTGGKMFGSIVGMVIGLAISIVTSWILYSVLKKRTEELKALNYDGILDFIFVKTFPKLILTIGELLFVLIFHVGILVLVSALVGSSTYAPLSGFAGLLLNVIPGMDMLSEMIPVNISSDYDYFSDTIKIGILVMLSSLVALMASYVYTEVYKYSLKLVTNLINFMPKFAIPVAIRKRTES